MFSGSSPPSHLEQLCPNCSDNPSVLGKRLFRAAKCRQRTCFCLPSFKINFPCLPRGWMALPVIICKVNPGWKLQRTEPFHLVHAGSIEVHVNNHVPRGESKILVCKQMQFTVSRNNWSVQSRQKITDWIMFNWVQQRNSNAIFLRHRAANQATALFISFKVDLLSTHKKALLCNTVWTGKYNIVNVLLYKLLRWQGPCTVSHTTQRQGLAPFFSI